MNSAILDKSLATNKSNSHHHATPTMKAITFSEFGGPEVLNLATIDCPKPSPDQVLVRVHAAAINRVDLNIRNGKYNASLTQPQILGLEIAGDIVELGSNVTQFKMGQRVFGLVSNGGYAEYCLLDKDMAIVLPDSWSYIEAAAVPEAFLTADETLFNLGGLKENESILIHAAGSGVGTAAVQMAHYVGAHVYFSASSQQKIDRIHALGGMIGINYKTHDFAEEILRLTEGKGVDVVEDFIGGPNLARNLKVLKKGGRLLIVGLMGGHLAEIDLSMVLFERLKIMGSVMRNRSLEEKRLICQRFQQRWMPILSSGKIKPVIDTVYSLTQVRTAHQRMHSNQNFGKIVLQVCGTL